MKYLKFLILAIVAVFTFASAEAHVQIKAEIGGRGRFYHQHHYYHHRYRRHHRWVYQD